MEWSSFEAISVPKTLPSKLDEKKWFRYIGRSLKDPKQSPFLPWIRMNIKRSASQIIESRAHAKKRERDKEPGQSGAVLNGHQQKHSQDDGQCSDEQRIPGSFGIQPSCGQGGNHHGEAERNSIDSPVSWVSKCRAVCKYMGIPKVME